MESHLDPASETLPSRVWAPRRHHWWIAIAILMACASVVLWWNMRSGNRQGAFTNSGEGLTNAPAIRVRTQSVTSRIAPEWLTVTGTVRPELEASIGGKVLGRVQSVLVREGESVRRGQTLVLLDARDLDASIAQASANLRASSVGYNNAEVAARMEASLSSSRIAEARAKIAQSEAALEAANAKLELVQAGPRRQEREQATLAVTQARSNLTLADGNLKRMTSLYRDGAISAQQYDQYRSQFEVARAQYETAQQGQSITDEGSRTEEIRAAQQAVGQARAAVQEARAGLKSAEASAMQAEVRRQEIQGAKAQIGQSQAGLTMARVARSYAIIAAPFAGVVTGRLADPGAMASPGVPLLKVQGGALRLEAVVPESVLVTVRKGETVPVHFDALRNRSLTGRVVEIAPQGDAASHTFIVKVALPPGSGAAPGMFGRARFRTGSESQLLVPASAAFRRDGLDYVFVVDRSGIARLRMITVGAEVNRNVPVLSGLKPGERLVIDGINRIVDGSRVAAETR